MLSQNLFHLHDQMADWTRQLEQNDSSFMHLPKEKLQEMHQLAFVLYRQKNYSQAVHFYRLLTLACPEEVKFWKGLAACLKVLKDEKEALKAYEKAQQLNENQKDPYLYVYMADCYFALKQREEGLKMLKAARLRAEKLGDLRILKHVIIMHELWSK